MPVFHFAYHAHRSWNTDKKRGWVQHGEKGVKRPSKALAAYRDQLAKHPPMRFAGHQQRGIIKHMREIARRRGWEPYAISADPTHVHVVISWKSDLASELIRRTLKRLTGLLLAKDAGTKGIPYFCHDEDEEPVRKRSHLRYLMYVYLPDHKGAFWRRELASVLGKRAR